MINADVSARIQKNIMRVKKDMFGVLVHVIVKTVNI